MRNYKEHLLLSKSLIKEALYKLDALAKDAILFIVDKEDKLIGSLTDGDVRRGLLKGKNIEDSVDSIIQNNPRFIRKGERNINKVVEYREGNFRIIPILNSENQVVNVINFRKIKSYLPVDAVIMAGGEGQRLRPLTLDTPKPLLKIGEKPIIDFNIDRLSQFGIDDFWISLNYLGDKIEAHVGNGDSKNLSINYIREDKPLGTIGAISLIHNFQHEYILVTNADILTNLDYEHFFMEFLRQNADLAVATIPYNVNVPYAVLETSNGHVVSFKEKPTYTYYSNGGIYLIKRELIDLIPANTFFNTTDLMELLIKMDKKVISYPLMGYWLDIGKHEDFEKAQEDVHLLNL